MLSGWERQKPHTAPAGLTGVPEHSRSLWLPQGAVQWRGGSWIRQLGAVRGCAWWPAGVCMEEGPQGALSVIWAPRSSGWGGACLHPDPAILRLLARLLFQASSDNSPAVKKPSVRFWPRAERQEEEGLGASLAARTHRGGLLFVIGGGCGERQKESGGASEGDHLALRSDPMPPEVTNGSLWRGWTGLLSRCTETVPSQQNPSGLT